MFIKASSYTLSFVNPPLTSSFPLYNCRYTHLYLSAPPPVLYHTSPILVKVFLTLSDPYNVNPIWTLLSPVFPLYFPFTCILLSSLPKYISLDGPVSWLSHIQPIKHTMQNIWSWDVQRWKSMWGSSFWAWVTPLSINYFFNSIRLPAHFLIFIFLYIWIIFHCVCVPHFYHPFITQWASKFIRLPLYCEWRGSE